MSSRKNLSVESIKRLAPASLHTGEVAQRVGISSSALRAWEALGLIVPQRTKSKYRLYSELTCGCSAGSFLAACAGLNPAAIVHILKSRSVISSPADGGAIPGPALLRPANSPRTLAGRGRTSQQGFREFYERAGTVRRQSFGRRAAADRKILSHQYSVFFDADGENPRQVRPAQRKVLEAGPGVRMELLAWGNAVMEPHLFRVAAESGSGDSYAHEGEEFIYVLRGALNITLEKEEYRLKAGDSFYFESATPHHWKNPGRSETWLLWVNTPPTF